MATSSTSFDCPLCCFECECGRYPTTGQYYQGWFGTLGNYIGDCPGRGNTINPESFDFDISFESGGAYPAPNFLWDVYYRITFVPYNYTTPPPSFPFDIFSIGRWTNTGSIAPSYSPSNPTAPNITFAAPYLYFVLYRQADQNNHSALIVPNLANLGVTGSFASYDSSFTVAGYPQTFVLKTAYPPTPFNYPLNEVRTLTRVTSKSCCPVVFVNSGRQETSETTAWPNVTASSTYPSFLMNWTIRKISNCFPYWCVDGECVQSETAPAGATGGPWNSPWTCFENCQPSPTGNYWCLYGSCVFSETQPDPSATGPYETYTDCAENCEGPAEMVWICGEDSGCGLISRADAIMLGYTYYFTQVDCEENCSGQWWCTADGCVQWWGGGTPPGALSGPYPTQELCTANCNTGPGYYCVDGACAFYSSAPPGATAGPYATMVECSGNCFIVAEGKKEIKKPVPLEVIRKLTTPCVYLGNYLENLESCGCNKKNALRECSLFGKARVYGLTKSEDEKVCFSCPSYKPSITK